MDLRTVVYVLLCSFLVVPTALAQTGAGKATLKRGEMLSVFGGCSDCHTPKIMTAQGPAPDQTRLLSGLPGPSPGHRVQGRGASAPVRRYAPGETPNSRLNALDREALLAYPVRTAIASRLRSLVAR